MQEFVDYVVAVPPEIEDAHTLLVAAQVIQRLRLVKLRKALCGQMLSHRNKLCAVNLMKPDCLVRFKEKRIQLLLFYLQFVIASQFVNNGYFLNSVAVLFCEYVHCAINLFLNQLNICG